MFNLVFEIVIGSDSMARLINHERIELMEVDMPSIPTMLFKRAVLFRVRAYLRCKTLCNAL